MVNKIAIIYFSGTGNTEQIAKELGVNFENSGKSVTFFKAEDLIKNPAQLIITGYETIGFGYPVHAFGVPKIYKKLLKILPTGNNIKTFTFKTMGDPLCNGGSNKDLRKQLAKKGYIVFYEAMYVMQANIGIRYEDELIEKLYLFAKEKAKYDVKNIIENKKSLLKSDFLTDVFSIIFNNSEHSGSSLISSTFYVNKNCTLCGNCVKICPESNIKIEHKKIKFGSKCTFCMRCFYECPEDSINTFLPIKLKGFKSIQTIIKSNKLCSTYLRAPLITRFSFKLDLFFTYFFAKDVI